MSHSATDRADDSTTPQSCLPSGEYAGEFIPANRAVLDQQLLLALSGIEQVIIPVSLLLIQEATSRGPRHVETLAHLARGQGCGELPSAFASQTRALPPSFDANATERPSGDQTPPMLKAFKNVSCLGVPPVAGIV